jgi:hypothetical protein
MNQHSIKQLQLNWNVCYVELRVCVMQIMWNSSCAQYLLYVVCGILEENGDEEAAHLRPLHVGVNRVLMSAGGIVNKALTELQREPSDKEANSWPIAGQLLKNCSWTNQKFV